MKEEEFISSIRGGRACLWWIYSIHATLLSALELRTSKTAALEEQQRVLLFDYSKENNYLLITSDYCSRADTNVANMSSFRFNFSGVDEKKPDSDTQEEIQWLESVEVVPKNQIKDLNNIVNHAQMVTCGDVEIGHVVVSEALSNIIDTGLKTAVNLAENEHSDLVAGKYEGGLKIWECTNDLLYYLVQSEEIDFENKQVLDLGCGAGILGIYAFMKSAHVTFQDYNKEVLDYVTIPNVLLNIEEEERESGLKKCKFYSGDWASFNRKIDTVFDVIVTSETIYNECNYDKLISLFKERLCNNGVVYVAAKTHYFGVGGGTRQFEKAVEKKGLLSKVCWKSLGGFQREILKITKL